MTTTNKKNPVGVLLFLFFIGFLPIATFFFSKSGLDVHKNIKKEMRFHKDSIRINIDNLVAFGSDTLSNTDLLEKITIVCFWNEKNGFDATMKHIRQIQSNFKEEDQIKMKLLVHTAAFAQDSAWQWNKVIRDWEIDTASCKFVYGGDWKPYQFEQKPTNSQVALLDGRVSRKDKTKNYTKGSILCDIYDLDKAEDKKKLLRNMVVVLPKKNRKRLEFEADTSTYKF